MLLTHIYLMRPNKHARQQGRTRKPAVRILQYLHESAELELKHLIKCQARIDCGARQIAGAALAQAVML
jgi:hypothetical protein